MQVGGEGFQRSCWLKPQGFCNGNAISCSPDDSSVLTAYDIDDPVNGGFFFTIGTSVASPEFVGALAIYEQQFGKHHRQGNVNYFLYAQGAIQSLFGGNSRSRLRCSSIIAIFRAMMVTGMAASPAPTMTTFSGNGSPDIRKLFGLKNYPAAGLPQTPSNP